MLIMVNVGVLVSTPVATAAARTSVGHLLTGRSVPSYYTLCAIPSQTGHGCSVSADVSSAAVVPDVAQPTIAANGDPNPPDRTYPASAFDAATNSLIEFGGLSISNDQALNDTWAWNGTAWSQLFPTSSPPGRYFTTMAYDPATRQLVLYGGLDASNNLLFLTDTWVFDGTTWTQEASAGGPGFAFETMTYDAATNQLLLIGIDPQVQGNATWEWTGNSWQAVTDIGPSAALFPSVAFDSNMNQLLFFGGIGASGASSETWSWNGFGWAQLAPSISPPARAQAPMGYDPVSGDLILFGGLSGLGCPATSALKDTWEWNGSTWNQLTPSQSPPTFFGNTFLVDDPATSQVVLPSDGIFNATWNWNGTDWSNLVPGEHSPPARTGSASTYDPAIGAVVSYGGIEETGLSSDTWAYSTSSSAWSKLTTASSPPPLFGAAMDYDAAIGKVVLFGGQTEPFFCNPTAVPISRATWEFDGTNWSQVATTTSPSGGAFPTVTFDAASSQLIEFGGVNADSTTSSSTWLFTGTDWAQLIPSASPPARFGASAAYDSASSMVVLFGGGDPVSSTAFGDTWTWNGTSWSQVVTASAPSPRSNAGMAYSGMSSSVVLFGGIASPNINSVQALGDTWAFDGTNWIQLALSGSPADRFAPAAMAALGSQGSVLLYGGLNDQGLLYDSWFWDGVAWSESPGVTVQTQLALQLALPAIQAFRKDGHVAVVSQGSISTTAVVPASHSPTSTPLSVEGQIDQMQDAGGSFNTVFSFVQGAPVAFNLMQPRSPYQDHSPMWNVDAPSMSVSGPTLIHVIPSGNTNELQTFSGFGHSHMDSHQAVVNYCTAYPLAPFQIVFLHYPAISTEVTLGCNNNIGTFTTVLQTYLYDDGFDVTLVPGISAMGAFDTSKSTESLTFCSEYPLGILYENHWTVNMSQLEGVTWTSPVLTGDDPSFVGCQT